MIIKINTLKYVASSFRPLCEENERVRKGKKSDKRIPEGKEKRDPSIHPAPCRVVPFVLSYTIPVNSFISKTPICVLRLSARPLAPSEFLYDGKKKKPKSKAIDYAEQSFISVFFGQSYPASTQCV